MKRLFITTLAITLLFSGLPSTARTANEVIVQMTSQGFEPNEVSVQKGDTVVFKNNDSEYRWPASNLHPTHNIYPEFDPKVEMAPGSSWEFTFEDAGTWKYHDHLLPQHSGTITVIDGESSGDKNQAKQGFWSKLADWFKGFWYRITHWGKARPETTSATGNTNIASYTLDITEGNETIFSEDTALGSHLKKYGPHKTITALRLLEPKFGSCHQPAHRAGHMGYALFGDEAFVEYSPECQSGYYHGVMEAYFKEHGADNIAQSLDSLCRGGMNNFFEHQCIHGIGHGLTAWANYELPEALAACDLLPKRQDSCWTGVFMENLSAKLATTQSTQANTAIGTTDVHVTKYLSAEDPLYPCNWVADKYQNSCYFLQTSRMLQIFGQNFQKVAAACSTAPAMYQHSCYGSMGRDVSGNFPTDNQRQIQECGHVQNPQFKIYCLNGAVQNSFWDPSGQDKAIDFCTRLQLDTEKQGCYETIISRAAELLSTVAHKTEFCTALEPSYSTKCKQQLQT